MSAKVQLLDAALQVIREQGYSASTVDDLCQAAGVTKDAFFHHFTSNEALVLQRQIIGPRRSMIFSPLPPITSWKIHWIACWVMSRFASRSCTASLAFHTQAVIQGAFILAKATGNTQVAADSIDYLRCTIESLFHQPELNKVI